MTGLCDAAGVDMADVADVMLAEAAAQLPRDDAAGLGDPAAAGDARGELQAVDSPLTGGSTRGNSASTTFRRDTNPEDSLSPEHIHRTVGVVSCRVLTWHVLRSCNCAEIILERYKSCLHSKQTCGLHLHRLHPCA